MNSIKYLLLLLYLVVGSLQALELGQIKVDSHLYEPLKASFTIGNISADNLGDIIVNIADIESYGLLGLSRPSYVTRFIFTIMPGQGLQHRVQISSRQRIREPIIELLVNVTAKQSKVMRLYTVMLDPVMEGTYAESTQYVPAVDTSAIDSPADPVGEPGPVGELDMQPIATTTTGEAEIKQDVTRILADNTNLSLIAQNSLLHNEFSVYQIMRAFYLDNPAAFIKGNINRLKSSSLLSVPATDLVAEVSRQKAIKFVYAASRDYPFSENPEMPAATELNATSPAKVTVPDSVIPVGTEAKSVVQTLPMSQDFQQDLTAWRGMTDEFKTLSSIVETQNRAIKLQSGVLQEMSTQLNVNSNDFVQLSLRLEAVETSPQTSQVIDGRIATDAASGLRAELNRVKKLQSQSISAVNERLDVKNQQILKLNSRIEVLEEQQLTSASKALFTGPPKVIPDAAGIDSWNGLKNGSLIGLLVLNALVLIFVLGREYFWRRRLISTTNLKPKSTYSKSNHVTHKSQTSSSSSVDEDRPSSKTNKVQQSIAMTPDQIPPVSVQKQEAPKPDQKLSPKNVAKPVSRSRSVLEINAVKQVHSEIDVLIAYELFSEAQELVEATRKTDKDDRWLVLKEIEILGYTKDAEQFFAKFEEEKSSLSKEFPVAWNKIIKMRASLISEFKLKAIH